MINEITVSKRLCMKYGKGMFSFTKFKFSATNAQLYMLAMLLNAFQDETPEKVYLSTKSTFR
jgi:hypothetical protein